MQTTKITFGNTSPDQHFLAADFNFEIVRLATTPQLTIPLEVGVKLVAGTAQKSKKEGIGHGIFLFIAHEINEGRETPDHD